MSIQDLYKRLEDILGLENALVEEDVLDLYSKDALGTSRGYTGYKLLSPRPYMVVKPGSTEEVAQVVRLAVQEKVPLIPYGGGTGLMGGAVAVREGIVVDLCRMDQILEVRKEDRMALVQGGVVLGDLEARLNEEGLILGHDPLTLPVATVGGAISTNGLGYRGYKYGSMGEQVLGLEVVLPDGKVVRTRAVPKTSTGFSLNHLFIGAEGALGIITEAALSVFPMPERRVIHAFSFGSFEKGFEAIAHMFTIGIKPAVVDFGEEYPGSTLPGWSARDEMTVNLYLVFEGFVEEVAAQEERALRICREYGGRELGDEEAQGFWDTRHVIAERYRSGDRRSRSKRPPPSWPDEVKVDYVHVSIPSSKVLPYREKCQAILSRYGVHLRECGIWTRPELFSMVMVRLGVTEEEAVHAMAQAVDEVLTLAQEMGGSMEYCHGVGIRLAHLMEQELGYGLNIMIKIKGALDPFDIMNPGKLAL